MNNYYQAPQSFSQPFPQIKKKNGALKTSGAFSVIALILFVAAWAIPIIGFSWFNYMSAAFDYGFMTGVYVLLSYALPIIVSLFFAISFSGADGKKGLFGISTLLFGLFSVLDPLYSMIEGTNLKIIFRGYSQLRESMEGSSRKPKRS